ncbi:hypothetical protein [Aurantimonas sp. VKM B-3413]|uniref:hypothetical protein n=1 Tax=Aurantimonas sp. VKM B-3413 TaxID=2779401 RepID=UPI001E370E5B|nr:hypothetical protein [Aurantimonas sp. VKM B-3413]MCB8837030.1 hypothetical protein [Aurantimonas sp. VKM B-3413]
MKLFTNMMEDLAVIDEVHKRLALKIAAADVSWQQRAAFLDVTKFATASMHRASDLLLSWSLGEKAPSILNLAGSRVRH